MLAIRLQLGMKKAAFSNSKREEGINLRNESLGSESEDHLYELMFNLLSGQARPPTRQSRWLIGKALELLFAQKQIAKSDCFQKIWEQKFAKDKHDNTLSLPYFIAYAGILESIFTSPSL